MFLLLTCAPLTCVPHTRAPRSSPTRTRYDTATATLIPLMELHLQLLWSNLKIASTAIILVRQICPRHCLSQTTRSVIEEYLTSNEHSLSELATSISVIDSLNQPDNVIVRSWNKLETSPKTDCIDKNFPTWTCSNLNWSNISTNSRTSHLVLISEATSNQHILFHPSPKLKRHQWKIWRRVLCRLISLYKLMKTFEIYVLKTIVINIICNS